MLDDIDALKAQLGALVKENQRLVAESIRRKKTTRELQDKMATVTDDLSSVTREQNKFKSKAEKTPGSDNEEVEALKSQVRSYKHRDSLAELAYSKEIGINRSIPVDKLMRLIDYKSVSEEFDAVKSKQMLLSLKQTDPYLFNQSKAGSQPGQSSRPSNSNGNSFLNAVVSGLDKSYSSPIHGEALSEQQLRDPVYMSRYNARQRMNGKK